MAASKTDKQSKDGSGSKSTPANPPPDNVTTPNDGADEEVGLDGLPPVPPGNPKLELYLGGHRQPPAEERIEEAWNFLADEDYWRCLDFERKLAEIESYMLELSKHYKQMSPELQTKFLEVAQMASTHRNWIYEKEKLKPIDWSFAGVKHFSKRLVGRDDVKYTPRPKKKTGHRLRPDKAPFSSTSSIPASMRSEFLDALWQSSGKDPYADDFVKDENLFNIELENYSHGLRDAMNIQKMVSLAEDSDDHQDQARVRGMKRAALETCLQLLADNNENRQTGGRLRYLQLPEAPPTVEESKEWPIYMALPEKERRPEIDADPYYYTKKLVQFIVHQDQDAEQARAANASIHRRDPTHVPAPANFRGPYQPIASDTIAYKRIEGTKQYYNLFKRLADTDQISPRPVLSCVLIQAMAGVERRCHPDFGSPNDPYAMNPRDTDLMNSAVLVPPNKINGIEVAPDGYRLPRNRDIRPLDDNELSYLKALTEPSWTRGKRQIPDLPDEAANAMRRRFFREIEEVFIANPNVDYNAVGKVDRILEKINHNMADQKREMYSLQQCQGYLRVMNDAMQIMYNHDHQTLMKPQLDGHPEDRFITEEQGHQLSEGEHVQYNGEGDFGPPIPLSRHELYNLGYRMGRILSRTVKKLSEPGKETGEQYAAQIAVEDAIDAWQDDAPIGELSEDAQRVKDVMDNDQTDRTRTSLVRLSADLVEQEKRKEIDHSEVWIRPELRQKVLEEEMRNLTIENYAASLRKQLITELHRNWQPMFPAHDSLWSWVADLPDSEQEPRKFFSVNKWPPFLQSPARQEALAAVGPPVPTPDDEEVEKEDEEEGAASGEAHDNQIVPFDPTRPQLPLDQQVSQPVDADEYRRQEIRLKRLKAMGLELTPREAAINEKHIQGPKLFPFGETPVHQVLMSRTIERDLAQAAGREYVEPDYSKPGPYELPSVSPGLQNVLEKRADTMQRIVAGQYRKAFTDAEERERKAALKRYAKPRTGAESDSDDDDNTPGGDPTIQNGPRGPQPPVLPSDETSTPSAPDSILPTSDGGLLKFVPNFLKGTPSGAKGTPSGNKDTSAGTKALVSFPEIPAAYKVPTKTQFTEREVLKHTQTEEDMWIVVDDIVLNVTKLMNKYPDQIWKVNKFTPKIGKVPFYSTEKDHFPKSVLEEYASKMAVGRIKRRYTEEEVLEHTQEGDLWMVVDGIVMDLTDFPHDKGGLDKLLAYAGLDATRAFRDPLNHSLPEDILNELAPQYAIGFMKEPLAFPPGMEVPNKEFTWEEVRKHTKKGDLWEVIDNIVFEVSNFEKHPGGLETLLKFGGKRGTAPFRKAHQFSNATLAKKVKDLVIGRIKPFQGPLMLPKGFEVPEQEFTLEEIGKHDRIGDMYEVVEGMVFDVSNFKHPGGMANLVKFRGGDATAAFKKNHQDPNATIAKTVNKLVIGRVKGAILPTSVQPSTDATSTSAPPAPKQKEHGLGPKSYKARKADLMARAKQRKAKAARQAASQQAAPEQGSQPSGSQSQPPPTAPQPENNGESSAPAPSTGDKRPAEDEGEETVARKRQASGPGLLSRLFGGGAQA